MKAFILVVGSAHRDGRTTNYTFSDFDFASTVPKDLSHYPGSVDRRPRPGYDSTYTLTEAMADLPYRHAGEQWALVSVDVDPVDLAFSYELVDGERMYGYPYCKWVRDVDFGDKNLSQEQARNSIGCTLQGYDTVPEPEASDDDDYDGPCEVLDPDGPPVQLLRGHNGGYGRKTDAIVSKDGLIHILVDPSESEYRPGVLTDPDALVNHLNTLYAKE